MTGQTDTHREWIYSNIAASVLVRDGRYLLEAVNPMLGLPEGRLYDCGDSRDGRGYRRVREAEEKARVMTRFQPIVDRLPPLSGDHTFWSSKKGRQFHKLYTSAKDKAKHLHNHKDYQFYDEE